MAVSEIIELTQILLNLLGKKSELDRKYFMDFIDPAWNSFIKSHENYKLSLQEYSQLLRQEDTSLSEVVEKIEKDLVYTSDLRSDLKAIIGSIPPPKPDVGKAGLSTFVGAIISYFYSPMFLMATVSKDKNLSDELWFDLRHSDLIQKYGEIAYDEPSMIANYARATLLSFGKNTKDDVFEMQILIGNIMQILQKQYDKVAEAYYQLRKELLS